MAIASPISHILVANEDDGNNLDKLSLIMETSIFNHPVFKLQIMKFKKNLFIPLFISNILFAQTNILPTIDLSHFKGGEKCYKLFLKKNLKWPGPDWDGQGTVFVEIIIDEKGNIKNSKIMNPNKGMELAYKEALRVTKLMPKWSPLFDIKTNKFIQSKIILPFRFYLNP